MYASAPQTKVPSWEKDTAKPMRASGPGSYEKTVSTDKLATAALKASQAAQSAARSVEKDAEIEKINSMMSDISSKNSNGYTRLSDGVRMSPRRELKVEGDLSSPRSRGLSSSQGSSLNRDLPDDFAQ
jgi:hypothetical protein